MLIPIKLPQAARADLVRPSHLRYSAFLDTRRLALLAQMAVRRCRGFIDFLARFYFRLKFRGKVRLVHGHAASG